MRGGGVVVEITVFKNVEKVNRFACIFTSKTFRTGSFIPDLRVPVKV